MGVDIEDVARKGSSMRGCPYFATKAALVDADVVFAPYNYLVDPLIRESMCIDLSDCIVVFDEAHNIQVVRYCFRYVVMLNCIFVLFAACRTAVAIALP